MAATFLTARGRRVRGPWREGSSTRLDRRRGAEAIAARAPSGAGRASSSRSSTKPKSSSRRRSSTTSPSCSARPTGCFGFSAQRTLGAAQALYEQHKLLTYPRTSSRYLSGDMVGQLKSVGGPRRRGARLDVRRPARARHGPRAAAARPRRQRRQGHRPPRDHPDRRRARPLRPRAATSGASTTWSARRFLAIFHPPARFEHTTVETARAARLFRSRGKVLIEAGWRAVYGEDGGTLDGTPEGRGDEEAEQALPALERGSPSAAPRPRRWRSRPSRRRATRRPRCCARWRPPASSSRTTRRPRR